MTLDEAIKHAKAKAKEQRYYAKFERNRMMYQSCVKCAEEHEQLAEWLEQLKEYKQLEEQGRLIKLPCKIGDTIYEIHYANRQYVICSHIVSKFIIMPYRFPRVEIYFENENGFSTSDFEGRVNEDLFLTRDEAEAKLKELRGVENGR